MMATAPPARSAKRTNASTDAVPAEIVILDLPVATPPPASVIALVPPRAIARFRTALQSATSRQAVVSAVSLMPTVIPRKRAKIRSAPISPARKMPIVRPKPCVKPPARSVWRAVVKTAIAQPPARSALVNSVGPVVAAMPPAPAPPATSTASIPPVCSVAKIAIAPMVHAAPRATVAKAAMSPAAMRTARCCMAASVRIAATLLPVGACSVSVTIIARSARFA